MNNRDLEKQAAAKTAVKLVKDGQIVGLGTGSTAYYAVLEIGRLVKDGLKIKAIPTSDKTEALAHELGIEIIDINSVDEIDITIDGADEFTKDLLLIKGGGGALLREKIVASITRQEIIIADSSKRVDQLGKFKVPIEIIPFAANGVEKQLKQLNGVAEIRKREGKIFVTDEGNHIMDADFGLIHNPIDLAASIKQISGVVEHGLFIKLASKIIMGKENGTVVFEH